jgi:sn1-specific diacylglycerol lipase
MIIAFDPLGNCKFFAQLDIFHKNYLIGARKYRRVRDANGNLNDVNAHHEFMHTKVSKLWLRRFRLAFCCLTKDEYGDEAFSQTAELFSNLFNGTDLTPTGKQTQ